MSADRAGVDSRTARSDWKVNPQMRVKSLSLAAVFVLVGLRESPFVVRRPALLGEEASAVPVGDAQSPPAIAVSA